METSSSTEECLRFLMDSKMLGSTFSESESSGDACLRLSEGAELGAVAEHKC
jgi:hypothetical protein